jgi:hypothetical protein
MRALQITKEGIHGVIAFTLYTNLMPMKTSIFRYHLIDLSKLENQNIIKFVAVPTTKGSINNRVKK